MRRFNVLILSLLPGLTVVSAGCKSEPGTSCTVADNGDGTATISCTDGTAVTIEDGTDGQDGTPGVDGEDGEDGEDGTGCLIADNGDGTSTITCEDGTTVTLSDGSDGGSCVLVENGDGSSTITCDDGSSVVVSDGLDGGPMDVAIESFHGIDHLQSTGEFATAGKMYVDAEITSATADSDGTVTVNFTVTTLDGDPIVNIPAISSNIMKLVPPGTGHKSTSWMPYIWTKATVTGNTFPNPAGTVAWQPGRDNKGVLTHLGDGEYEYVYATNISALKKDTTDIAFERDLTHRVAIMMGGHSGATADAWLDFVPSGGSVTLTRNIVETDTCKSCHGPEFHGHGGDRLSAEICVTCHAPGATDPQGGESIDMMPMIHKIHMGGELPSVRGEDHDPWATADNGTYAIWGYRDTKHSWEKVGFPAVIQNCTKCHQGSGEDVDNWKNTPSREACGSCHDTLEIGSPTTTHEGGQQTDDASCGVCHGATSGSAPVVKSHDWTVQDPRNLPEHELALTLSAPANGKFYEKDEAPVITIKIKKNGTPLADHKLVQGSAEGCVPTGTPKACPADADGKWATTALYLQGPRAARMPALTTGARAQIFSKTTGPFDLSATGASLTVKLDQGRDVVTQDAWGTLVPGKVTVPVSSGTFANKAAATVTEVVAWLNADAKFKARAIAYEQGGKVGVRSRNLGQVYAIQLDAGPVTDAVFGGDVAVKLASGSNTLSERTDPALNDPKATRYADRIEYKLDPVTDLQAGTYVASLEFSQVGRKDGENYRTPAVIKVPFQVKQEAPEAQVAGNCDSCHQGPDGKGFVLDWPRHNKIFDATAVDQCGACHDYQPSSVVGTTWGGGKPIAKRVHAVHYGSSLNYPLGTVDYGNGDPMKGRNWDITLPQDVRNCEACHTAETSGTWATEASRLPCMGCHDADAAKTHMKLMTWDPTPADPWSGDEEESCGACH